MSLNIFLKENPGELNLILVDRPWPTRILQTFHSWLVEKRKTIRHMNDWPNKFMVRKWIKEIQAKR